MGILCFIIKLSSITWEDTVVTGDNEMVRENNQFTNQTVITYIEWGYANA